MSTTITADIRRRRTCQAQEEEGCGINLEWLGSSGSGATTASLFSEGWNWVKGHVKKIVATAVLGISTAVIGGITLVATLGCEAGSEGLDTFECYKIATFGAGFTLLAGYATVRAWDKTP